jgi:hypothetical protein
MDLAVSILIAFDVNSVCMHRFMAYSVYVNLFRVYIYIDKFKPNVT